MSVIVGNSTLVQVGFGRGATPVVNNGVVSIDWSFGGNVNRLYTLGGGMGTCGPNEFAIVRSAQIQVNLSMYGGSVPEISCCAGSVCENSPAVMVVTVVPAVCGVYTAEGISGKAVYLSSYGYNKDRTGFGTNTLQGSAYQTPATTVNGVYTEPEPTYIVCGVSTGTIEGETTDYASLEPIVGAQFRDNSLIETHYKGQVQASQTSLGEFSWIYDGTFKAIGNALFWAPGVKASANVTINTQPVYVAI
jgi:hypothetical protein